VSVQSQKICGFCDCNTAIKLLNHVILFTYVSERSLQVIFLLLQASIYILSTKSCKARGYSNMVHRKSRSSSFKVPPGTSLTEIKTAIENEITERAIKVFQGIGAYD